MARSNRGKNINPLRVQVMHVYNRCTRQAHLMGLDPVTGKDRSYRKGWVRERLQHLAEIFSIEILTYAVLSTHVHQVVRTRPDLAQQWDAEMVARKWLSITPKYDRKTGERLEPKPIEIKRIVDDAKRVEKLRVRLSDISWLMRYFAQNIAVRANREDGCTGHFWDQRFKAELLLDVASILRCMLYVDLNLVRAGIAESIQESDFTGAKDRLDDLRVALATLEDGSLQLSLESGGDAFRWERLEHPCSGWLSPIEIDRNWLESDQAGAVGAGDSVIAAAVLAVPSQGTRIDLEVVKSTGLAHAEFAAGGRSVVSAESGGVPTHDGTGDALVKTLPDQVRAALFDDGHSGHDGVEEKLRDIIPVTRRRASNKGALPLSVVKYLMLLDLVGRYPRSGGSGVISEEVEPLVVDLGISATDLMESIWIFDRRYEVASQSGRELCGQQAGIQTAEASPTATRESLSETAAAEVVVNDSVALGAFI